MFTLTNAFYLGLGIFIAALIFRPAFRDKVIEIIKVIYNFIKDKITGFFEKS